jgi:hypothetical protein
LADRGIGRKGPVDDVAPVDGPRREQARDRRAGQQGLYDRAGADDVGCPGGQVRGHHAGGDLHVFEAPIGEMVVEQGWKRC